MVSDDTDDRRDDCWNDGRLMREVCHRRDLTAREFLVYYESDFPWSAGAGAGAIHEEK